RSVVRREGDSAAKTIHGSKAPDGDVQGMVRKQKLSAADGLELGAAFAEAFGFLPEIRLQAAFLRPHGRANREQNRYSQGLHVAVRAFSGGRPPLPCMA